MTLRDTADESARSQTYALFSDIFLRGPVDRAGKIVLSLSEFSGLGMPEPEDERAAEFESLFGFNVFPYASAFLEPSGRLGMETSSLVRTIYESEDIDFHPSGEVDHVATELAFLSRLSNERLDAQGAKLDKLDAVTIDFLDHHVLAWLPAFDAAIQSNGNPFYRRISKYTLDVVVDHRRSLAEPARATSVSLPATPALLD